MGGRGGSSGMGGNTKLSGSRVTFKDGTKKAYFFTSKNGTNYYQEGINGIPNPTPLNMSEREFKRRVKTNGGKVERISTSEMRKAQKAYKEDRKSTSNFLNAADAQMGGNRGDQRRATRSRRGRGRGI